MLVTPLRGAPFSESQRRLLEVLLLYPAPSRKIPGPLAGLASLSLSNNVPEEGQQ